MTRRYSCKNAAVAVAGTNFAHGIGATPDEWSVNARDVPPAGWTCLYVTAAPDGTNVNVASSSAAYTADIFCTKNHSIVK